MNLINLKRKYYNMASVDGKSAEITMYGDIVETRPVDWWTGEPVEGDYIMLDEFMNDLKQLENCDDITIRMNSYGGDATVSIVIHNRLRELAGKGTKLTCIVDGVAMSGGSIIMSACDTVKVNTSSIIMIHKAACLMFGYYNADELKNVAASNDAYDKAIVSAYTRRVNKTEDELLAMMSATTYMTGREAVDKGFADELLEGDAPSIAACANRTQLFVNGRKVLVPHGVKLPDSIPDMVNTGEKQPAHENKNSDNGGTTMITNVEELTAEYPELVNQVINSATTNAQNAERQRLRDIDAVANLFDSELVNEAKFGTTACTAQELAYRAAVNAAQQGRNFLNNLATDSQASGANAVPASTPPVNKSESEKTQTEKMNEAKSFVSNLLNPKTE